MANILICDDEKDIVNALKIYLSDPSYNLFCAYDGLQALELVKKEDIHLILLDIMMPQLDGISALAKIREISNAPVIILSAKSEDSDKILGLDVGADDYITKPFSPAEVVAHVRSQLRRYTKLGGGGSAKPQAITIGGLELVLSFPEKDLKIMADGRRMQRIFDNLFSNACKYAQEGTRVYVEAKESAGKAVITIKNTSKAALNISADELMERFVRGDSSRSTDGNGLGLSIAKSLAELQGGSLGLEIDADLFKAILTFPLI